MLFDTHTHTLFSTDSKMTIDEAVEKSRQLNIGITITEHMDFEYPEPKSFIFDADKYFSAYEPYRSDRVLIGVEIGMGRSCLEANCRLIEKYPFDYVIGSIHVIDNIDIYLPEFYQASKQEVYGRYFAAMLQCVTCYDCIHSLGHIDYIARYARFTDKEVYYHEFTEQIDEILKVLASKNKAMEINTRRLDNAAAVKNLLPIYQRFRELGGEMVTIGSDAHHPKDIGKGMQMALEMADYAKLKPVYFKEGNPIYVK